MAPRKGQKAGKAAGTWTLHDIYDNGVSSDRVVTRSQTPFLKIRNTASDLELFSDPSRHQPPGMPHLMEVMKGEYGAIPRTILTKSFAEHVEIDEKLVEELQKYKKYKP